MSSKEETTKPASFRAGFVALIGVPNAGKSTLLNTILEEKVSIVSEKPQTTRARVTGIVNRPRAQVVFVDAPGTIKSTSGINQFLQDEVKDVIETADVLCVLLAADQDDKSATELIATVRRANKPWFVVVTKSDLLGGTRTPKFFGLLIEEKIPFVAISSLKRSDEAREEVLSRVEELLPPSPAPLYDPELYTTQTVRQMTAEFIREACFANLRQEIPYGLAVKIVEFNEELPVPRIRAEIMVDRENHKSMVIGAGARTIKQIGQEARAKVERLVGRQVFLELRVQVREDWTKNPRMMKELGYVISER
jgi:GTP-binding protein Era